MGYCLLATFWPDLNKMHDISAASFIDHNLKERQLCLAIISQLFPISTRWCECLNVGKIT